MSIDPETFQDPDFQQELFVRFNEAMATFQENEKRHPHRDEYELDNASIREFEDACDTLILCHTCITPLDMSELEIDVSAQQATEEEEEQGPNPFPEHIHNIFELREYWDDRNRDQFQDELEAATQRYLKRRDMIEQAFFEAMPTGVPAEIALQQFQFESVQASGVEDNNQDPIADSDPEFIA